MTEPSDADAQIVLRRFRVGSQMVQRLGNCSGFSGARLWRVNDQDGNWCLKARPGSVLASERCVEIAQWQQFARAARLQFIPALAVADDGASSVEHGGWLWEMAEWMPGSADFHDRPTASRLQSACTALRRLHDEWRKFGRPAGPCPAIVRRLEAARQWCELVGSGWRPAFGAVDPVSGTARRAWPLVQRHISQIPQQLAPWIGIPMPLQPCLCDIWHDHVLFVGDEISGFIDFGSARLDSIVADLARMLGSMAADDAVLFAAGLDAYCQFDSMQRDLVTALDRTGVVLGLANWLRWLYEQNRQFENRQAVAERMAESVRRVEAW